MLQSLSNCIVQSSERQDSGVYCIQYWVACQTIWLATRQQNPALHLDHTTYICYWCVRENISAVGIKVIACVEPPLWKICNWMIIFTFPKHRGCITQIAIPCYLATWKHSVYRHVSMILCRWVFACSPSYNITECMMTILLYAAQHPSWKKSYCYIWQVNK